MSLLESYDYSHWPLLMNEFLTYGHVSDPLSNLKFKMGGLLIGLRCKYNFIMCNFLCYSKWDVDIIVRLLPLLIGDLVPVDNEHWNLYLILLQITEIVVAPQTTTSLAAHIRQLIAEHHCLFKTLSWPSPHTEVPLHGTHSNMIVRWATCTCRCFVTIFIALHTTGADLPHISGAWDLKQNIVSSSTSLKC